MDVAGRNLSKENAPPPSNHQTAATSEMVKMTAMTVQHQHPTNAVDIGSEQDPFKEVAKTAAYGKPGLIIPPDAVRRMDGVRATRLALTYLLF